MRNLYSKRGKCSFVKLDPFLFFSFFLNSITILQFLYSNLTFTSIKEEIFEYFKKAQHIKLKQEIIHMYTLMIILYFS